MKDPADHPLPKLRPDYLAQQEAYGDVRHPDRLVAHYMLERRLADRLLTASASERRQLYGLLYEELFSTLDDHPQHTAEREACSLRVTRQLRLLRPYVDQQARFVEIGCGDAALSMAMAQTVREAVGVDVTDALLPGERSANFTFVKTDGIALPIASQSVDLVYSNQLMEHLHPDDALEQLREIRRIIRPGGRYVCITPSRVTGPHDVSRYFDYEATGFHVSEYDYRSLRSAFQVAGFKRFEVVFTARGRRIVAPYAIARAADLAAYALPRSWRARFGRTRWADVLFAMVVIGRC
ncbi:class I SAM-dependent methyltransferase [Phenylobacterium montanum]|uniref:Class I SAM-dependent methyltransferase n=1 Tax=Phenylobacterium montanum TaxID=2823693 RepID=A0A975IVZ9_9CAUL|nr:class I SAM-dependent methyltransferase [Caulobacter sp. S6]QUD89310.1 class I SAM-dependent methyltransferase [Caulobacter sp. S6]